MYAYTCDCSGVRMFWVPYNCIVKSLLLLVLLLHLPLLILLLLLPPFALLLILLFFFSSSSFIIIITVAVVVNSIIIIILLLHLLLLFIIIIALTFYPQSSCNLSITSSNSDDASKTDDGGDSGLQRLGVTKYALVRGRGEAADSAGPHTKVQVSPAHNRLHENTRQLPCKYTIQNKLRTNCSQTCQRQSFELNDLKF